MSIPRADPPCPSGDRDPADSAGSQRSRSPSPSGPGKASSEAGDREAPSQVGCSAINLFAILVGVACGGWCAYQAACAWGWWTALPVFVIATAIGTYLPGLPVGMLLTVALIALAYSPPTKEKGRDPP